jgi:predicted HicB family RNase H-like nuclease
MAQDRSSSNITGLDRINLRLSAETFAEIDGLRTARAGRISRNTWITEAIEEKIARESACIVQTLAPKASNA